MTAHLIPVPSNASFWSDTLFNVTEPVTLTAEQFDTYWPLISTVYTKIGGLLLQRGGTVEVQKYECRLRKSKKGRKAPLPRGDGVRKRLREAAIRKPGLCNMRIKTTRTTAEPITITIERLDNEEHQHTLERSREIAPSALSLQLAAVELSKGYPPAQVLNALKGVGTSEGDACLIEIGGKHINR
ncbi:hypothetical protein BZA05DRAFT_401163 [Tricharina praecox]|uniref:uncharacterized protein n=1 Tax=Tricharina praecox TaxID=43433 RepID=UPI00221EFA17|nr:uncharacterized protein BZA05DRAFT_401163 [Tricharina praecox]KAI5849694.1 hypothetical protein BZA05DRAFT_401163 [Tricharina praecox]